MKIVDCASCAIYKNALTDAGFNEAMTTNEFNNRQNDMRANDIEQMIIEETDKSEVKRLQLMQFLINQNSGIISSINNLQKTVERDIDIHKKSVDQDIADHRREIESMRHSVVHHDLWVERIKTSWFWIVGAFGIAQVVFGFGLTRILSSMDNMEDMNLKTREYVHEAIPSNLKEIVSPVEDNANLISKLKSRIDAQSASIIQNEEDIEQLRTDVARIKTLKAVRGSK